MEKMKLSFIDMICYNTCTLQGRFECIMNSFYFIIEFRESAITK